jgi:hypothetical protein
MEAAFHQEFGLPFPNESYGLRGGCLTVWSVYDLELAEIDLQLQVAKRDLVQHAADLTVGLATDRIKRSITTDDQLRLVDRYVDQVKSTE